MSQKALPDLNLSLSEMLSMISIHLRHSNGQFNDRSIENYGICHSYNMRFATLDDRVDFLHSKNLVLHHNCSAFSAFTH